MHPDLSNERYLTAGQGGCRGDVVVGYHRDRHTVPMNNSAQLSGGKSEGSRWKVRYGMHSPCELKFETNFPFTDWCGGRLDGK